MAVAVALARILLQQAKDDAFRGWVTILANAGRARGRRRALHLEQAVTIAGAERKLSGENLEEQHAERVQIRMGSGLLAARLLGRHVLRRPEHGALGREPRIV